MATATQSSSRTLQIKEDLVQQIVHLRLPSPRLLHRGPDLLRRQHEPIVPAVRQLDQPRELCAAGPVHIICGAPDEAVQHRAGGAKRVRRAAARELPVAALVIIQSHGVADARGGARPLARLRRVQRLVVAPGPQEVLRVAVPVDVQPDARARGRAEPVDEGREPLVLGAAGGGRPRVGLGAGVRGGAARVGRPGVGPVAVDVDADAGLVGGGRRRGLAGLAPEAVRGLGVDEAWWEWERGMRDGSGAWFPRYTS